MPPQRGGRGGAGGGGIRKRKSNTSTRSGTTSRSNSEANIEQAQFPMPPTFVSTKTGDTPVNSPLINSAMKKRMVLTQAQKQALIDNLQLEITERARKLRAQYAFQAQTLRTRLELRIHRIPVGLRKLKVSDLLAKYEEREDTTKTASHNMPPPAKLNRQRPSPGKWNDPADAKALVSSPQKTKKRSSTEMDPFVVAEKESMIHRDSPPKKRLRTSAQEKASAATAVKVPAGALAPSPRRQIPPSQVLSPKSNNSRTLPQSPFKSPLKPSISSRPVSPLKPSVAVPTASSLAKAADRPTTAAGRAVARVNSVKSNPRAASRAGIAPKANTAAARTKKKAVGAAPTIAVVIDDSEEEQKRTSNASEMTNASAGTTIVTKTTTTTKRTAAPKSATGTVRSTKPATTAAKEKKTTGTLTGTLARGKKAVMAAATATTKAKAAKEKPVTKTAATAATTAATGRTLRKRG